MENQLPEETENVSPINFNEEIQYYLYETAKWGKFLSIVGFVFIGLIVLGALVGGIMLSSISSFNAGFPIPGGGMFIVIIYLIMAVLYFFPTFYLYRFSDYVKQGIHNSSELQLTEAFSNLKSLYKFWGIFTLVMIIIYGLIFIIAIIAGIAFMGAIN